MELNEIKICVSRTKCLSDTMNLRFKWTLERHSVLHPSFSLGD
jgi:hypothetical protein